MTSVSGSARPAARPNGIGAALGLLGDEWTLIIVQQCFLGVRRFSGFQEALGIGPTVLTKRLSAMVEAGILVREGTGQRTTYQLTDSGLDLWSLLLAVWAWEQAWVQGERLPTMRHLPCRSVFAPELACAGCGGVVSRADVDISFGPAGGWSRSVPVGTNRRRAGSLRPVGSGLFPETMALLGSRWSSALLGAAFLGARRFGEFSIALGAPPNVVSERLRQFVALEVLDEDYVLTAKGSALFAVVAMFVRWGELWHGAPDGAALVTTHRACGQAFLPVLHCSVCAGTLRRTDVVVEP